MQPPKTQSQQILGRAFAAHQAGNIVEAEFLYKLVLQADKRQFDALNMLGVIAGQRGNFAAGLARFNEALRVRPKSIRLSGRNSARSPLSRSVASTADSEPQRFGS